MAIAATLALSGVDTEQGELLDMLELVEEELSSTGSYSSTGAWWGCCGRALDAIGIQHTKEWSSGHGTVAQWLESHPTVQRVLLHVRGHIGYVERRDGDCHLYDLGARCRVGYALILA